MTLSLFILQVSQLDITPTPNILYDIAKQLLTIGSVVGLLWLLLKGKQKAIDDKAELLASGLTEFKAQVEKQITKLENELKEELKQFDLDYRDTERRVREIEKNYIARFEEVNHNISQLTTEVRVALAELKQFKKDS